jgi:hypothetical protein
MSKPLGYSTIGPIPVPDLLKEAFRGVCKEKGIHMEDQVVDCILKMVCEARPDLADSMTKIVGRNSVGVDAQ